MTKSKSKKKYTVITKIGNNPDGTAKTVKYRINNILNYVDFLDKNFSSWTWSNVFSNKGDDKGSQIGSFTKNNRPIFKSM